MATLPNIFDLVRKRFPSNEYALMEEVSNDAGFNRSRSADYIAVNLWPSRGLSVNGIELKSFRNDWLNELKNPKKAEAIFKYCDYFWLLTTDDTIAKIEEIPATWGWLCVKKGKITTMKEAPKQNPEPLSRGFVCAMLKRACDRTNYIHKDSIQSHIDAQVSMATERAKSDLGWKIKKAEELLQQVGTFEDITGLKFGERTWMYSVKELSESIRFVINGVVDEIEKRLHRLRELSNAINYTINKELQNLIKNENSGIENQSAA